MYCLICHQPISSSSSWVQFLSITMPQALCTKCHAKLETLSGEQCTICSRPFSKLAEDYRKNDVCYDCHRWEQDIEYGGVFTKNISIYYYNDFLKETIAQFKFRGDHELVKAFKQPLQQKFKQIFQAQPLPVIVPIPLSNERLYERGFNQTHSTATLLERPVDEVLKRTHSEKQSKKSRSQRLQSEQPFKIKDDIDLSSLNEKSILLIDDIYTTGTTLRKAAKLLQQLTPTSIYSLTIARS